MFFVLSKLLIYLLNPSIWILAGLAIALFAKNRSLKYRTLVITFVFLIIFTNPFLVNKFSQVWDIDSAPLPNSKLYSCVIVLGGFSSEGRNGEGYFNGSADRFIQALKLKNTGRVSHIFISGGNSQILPGKFRESVWVKGQLKLMNVPDSSILIESNSRNTLENAFFVKEALSRNNLPPPYLLVTSSFHMRRALYTFRKADVQVIPYPSNYITSRSKVSVDDFIPQLDVLNKWATYMKEIIGFGIYYVKACCRA